MLPDVSIFGKTITFYAISALIGILVVFAFSQIYTKKKGHDEIFMLFILLFSSIGIMVGGHLLYAITMSKYIIAFFQIIDSISSFKDILDWLFTIFGGSVFYGGLLGGILVAYLYMRKKKDIDLDPYIGIGTLCIPLFHTFGRIGCFLSGCCYGIECEYGLYFNHSTAPGCAGVCRFPVQLVEAGCNLLLFIVMFILYNKKRISGKSTFKLYLVSYATIRFCLEFLRGDEYRGFVGLISTSQFISLIIIFVVILFELVNKLIRKRKTIKNESM